MTQKYSNHPSYKPAHADKTQDLGNGYTVTRVLTGYAYGVTQGTSTPEYRWTLRLDGQIVDMSSTRRPLVEGARKDLYREAI